MNGVTSQNRLNKLQEIKAQKIATKDRNATKIEGMQRDIVDLKNLRKEMLSEIE